LAKKTPTRCGAGIGEFSGLDVLNMQDA